MHLICTDNAMAPLCNLNFEVSFQTRLRVVKTQQLINGFIFCLVVAYSTIGTWVISQS